MGEAKRRQQRDPNWRSPRVTIQESTTTNNYLVIYKGVTIDSAIHLKEAEAIKEWLVRELQERPLSTKRLNSGGCADWIAESPRIHEYPDSTSEIFIYSTDQKTVTTRRITVTHKGTDHSKEPYGKGVFH